MAPRSKTAGVSDKAVNEAAADSSGKAVNAADAVKKPGRKKSVLKTEPAAESDMAADSVKVEEKKAQSKKAAAKKECPQRPARGAFAPGGGGAAAKRLLRRGPGESGGMRPVHRQPGEN